MGCVCFWTSTNFGLAITEYHRPVAQKQYMWFLTVLEAGEARIRAAGTVLRAYFLLHSYCLLAVSPGGGGEGDFWGLLHKNSDLIHQGSNLGTSSPPRGPASWFHHIGQKNNAQREECTIRLFLSILISKNISNLSSRNVRFTNCPAIYIL